VSARILDGRAAADEVLAELAAHALRLARRPGLGVVLVGEDPASALYVRHKTRAAARLGYVQRQETLSQGASQDDVLAVVRALGADPDIDGILVQLPLPAHVSRDAVLDAIDPAKDVDGLHPLDAGWLSQGRPGLVPCTPLGVMELLRRTGLPLRGAEAVVVGRSNLVGRPMARLLEGADCTVTLCHRHTRALEAHVRRAEVLVVAAGAAGCVPGEWVREGAVVIDVGINRLPDGTLCGDVGFHAARARAAWITPVPGGVGPMTIAMLMRNTLEASVRRQPVLGAP
jgi:methylenetetrahydrofolate dehydrogenase (NADP+)/methenyltetrahydrofolate cyclohydrolase